MDIRICVCAAALLAVGCVRERYEPASSASMDPNNPCEELVEVRDARPAYPQRAVADSREGWVKLKYHVAASGAVFNVRVVASSPEGVFDQASAEALLRSRYAPVTYPRKNCSRIDVYRLDGGPIVYSPKDQAEFAAFIEELR